MPRVGNFFIAKPRGTLLAFATPVLRPRDTPSVSSLIYLFRSSFNYLEFFSRGVTHGRSADETDRASIKILVSFRNPILHFLSVYK